MALIGSRETEVVRGASGVPGWGAELDALLVAMTEAHGSLRDAGASMRVALARADRETIAVAQERQRLVMTRIAELDGQRRAVIRRAIESERELRRLDRAGRREPTIREIAGVLREPARSALVARGEALRALISETQREQRVLRAAAGSLAGHVQGLLAQLGRALDGAKTYSRSGGLAAGATPACGIDLTH